MKQNIRKIIALIICMSIMCSGTFVLAYNAGKKEVAGENTQGTEKKNNDSKISANSNVDKEETVYVMTNTDGSVKKIIVSDWIKNSDRSKKLFDKTELQNIKNVKGDEKYTINEDNMKIWDANGNDIYYQGETDKTLPVNIAVEYKLNNKTISAEELAGKSGKVTMRFDYANSEYQTVKINGKNEIIYVPFVMLTGMMLDNDVFTNVDISNGKIINDGDRSIVIGFALPGMNQNLNLNNGDDVSLPDYLEITADVKNFELATTLSIATNEMFNNIDIDKCDDIDDLINSMDSLTDAMDQLIDGSSALYSGVSTLLLKSDELINGINQLYDGAEQLKNGTAQVKNGTNDLSAGIDKLYSGLGTLTSNNKELTNGAKTVFETLLSTANAQIKQNGLTVEKLTISNYSKVLSKTISSLDESKIRATATAVAKEKVTSTVEAQREYIKAQVEVAVRQKVLEGVLSKLGYTYEQYKQAVSAGLIDTSTQSQIDATVEQTMNTSQIKEQITQTTNEKINSLISENLNSKEVQSQIEDAVKQAVSGANSLKTLKTQLDSYNQFYLGLTQYTNGVSDAYNGANQLKNGTNQLKNGTSSLNSGAVELYNGITSLRDGSKALVDGVKQLKDGSMHLADGIKQFNEQGIKKLSDAVNNDFSDIYERLKATINVSKDYQSFSGISDDMKGSTKFIFKSDSIEK